jgi:hypothetical protein
MPRRKMAVLRRTHCAGAAPFARGAKQCGKAAKLHRAASPRQEKRRGPQSRGPQRAAVSVGVERRAGWAGADGVPGPAGRVSGTPRQRRGWGPRLSFRQCGRSGPGHQLRRRAKPHPTTLQKGAWAPFFWKRQVNQVYCFVHLAAAGPGPAWTRSETGCFAPHRCGQHGR